MKEIKRETDSFFVIHIVDESGVTEARKTAREFLKQLAFPSIDQSRVLTAISELARNIYMYGPPGKIVLQEIQQNSKTGIKVIAADEGPGIPDIAKAMEPGFSTANGLGAGLPGVRNLMDEFDCASEVGKGTIVTAIKWLR